MDIASALRQHSTVIDGDTYYATAWPARQALQMGARLCEVFGEAGTGLLYRAFARLETAPPSAEDAAKNIPASMGALLLSQAAQSLAKDPIEVIRDAFRSVRCSAVRVGEHVLEASVYEHFDSHFQGRYDHLFAVFSWVVRVSFSLPAGERR